MRKFAGFDMLSDGVEKRTTGVPAAFFSQLLPQITNLDELKTTLYTFFLASQKKGEPKWVGYWELAEAEDLLSGLKSDGDPRPAEERLRKGLELALTRGSIIRLVAAPPPPEFFQGLDGPGELEPVSVTWFLVNTAYNREFTAKLENGEIQIEQTGLLQGLDLWDWPLPSRPRVPGSEENGSKTTGQIQEWKKGQETRLHLRSQRPDIFTLYEQNIGPLTPILSERLREAGQLYPAEWVETAFSEAVKYNRRSWAYISRILENWATDGRNPQERREREGVESRPSRRGTPSGPERRRDPMEGNGTYPAGTPAVGETKPGAQPPQRSSPPGRERRRAEPAQPGAGQLIQWRGAEIERKRQQFRRLQSDFQESETES